jgi:uncharacterized lipoprotein YddW (UPF0748 family)
MELSTMTTWTCLLMLSLSTAEAQSPIESFAYKSDHEAHQQWHAFPQQSETTLVSIITEGERNVTQLAAPFATHIPWDRVYIDRQVNLDLAAAGEFELEVLTTSPAAEARLTLYFHSGQGWYAAGNSLYETGWQTLRFSKASFSIEDQPTGWHQVDAIRIAVWRGKPVDHTVRLRALRAVQNDVAIIVPSPNARAESQTASQTAELVGGMLRELGLGSDAIEEQAIADGALGDRDVAILAYTPGLSNEAVAGLVQYAERGGKVLVCYQLPTALGNALGFSHPAYFRQEREGQFAEVRFNDKTMMGLPAAMRQASWNITAAQPSGFQARVVGYWYDLDGQPTNQPALLVSERGAFFSHIFLPDDRATKQRMLAALLGHLAPDLWKQMATAALEQCGQAGHCTDLDSAIDYLSSSPRAEVAKALKSAHLALSQAHKAMLDRKYPEAINHAASVHQQLVQAYLLAQPSRHNEGRACWNHTGTGAYPGDWERTARELADAGFNMVLPNMLWGGRAHYASEVLPRSRTFQQYGDQIEQCVTACKKHGLEVHVWKVNWNLSGAPADFIHMVHAENRNQMSVDGQAHDWLCPSHPENQQLELASMLEVAKNYDVDGLHFDYIRYPDRTKCYCDGCRQRFEQHRRREVSDWPQACYSGKLRAEYTQWRCDQITQLVKAVHEHAKRLRPNIQISAAVFGAYPSCRESVGQDWPEWVKADYLDFVCPMDYTQDDTQFAKLVSSQLELVSGRIPIYPGIGQWRLSEDRTVGQIHLARKLGAAGFTMFDLTPESIRSAVPAIRLGVGSDKTTPVHSVK